MKTWKNPEVVALEINETSNYNNANNPKMCPYDGLKCKNNGQSWAPCKNCKRNTGSGNTDLGDTDLAS